MLADTMLNRSCSGCTPISVWLISGDVADDYQLVGSSVGLGQEQIEASPSPHRYCVCSMPLPHPEFVSGSLSDGQILNTT